MRFKKTALGLVTAAALSLSLASGAIAQDAGTKTTLDPNPNGTCSLSIGAGATADLGAWEWNGTTFVGGTYSVIWMGNTQNIMPRNEDANCKISVKGTDLTNGADGTIPVNNIKVTHGSGYNTLLSTSDQMLGGIVNSAGIRFDLVSFPDDLPLGNYTGTVTFTASQGT